MSKSSQPLQREVFSCADLLKALADQTRLDVVRFLLGGSAHVAEIGAELKIEQSLLSHHLRVLREAGIVRAIRDGKAVLYSLAPAVNSSGRKKDRIDLGCCSLTMRS